MRTALYKMAAILRRVTRPLIVRPTVVSFLNKFGPTLYFHQNVTQKSNDHICRNLGYSVSQRVFPRLYQTTRKEHQRFLHQPIATGESAIQQISNALPLVSLERYDNDRCLNVTWSNNDSQMYPYPWLRDNCRCNSCYSHSTYSRTTCFLDLDVEAVPRGVTLSSDGNRLDIKWPDGHTSEYSTSWLLENRFNKSKDDHIFHPQFRYWAKNLDEVLRTFKFSDVVKKDSVLYEMLMELKTLGICRVTGAGDQEGEVKKIADRVAFLHVTYFG